MKRQAELTAIDYPGSDGKPLAESERHAIATVDAWQALKRFFASRPDVYVGMDMLLYHVEGDPRRSVVPDVFVVLGAPKLPHRDTWLLWEEGRAPDFVLEVTSRTTRREDEGRKRRLYRDLGVAEYWQFDPTGDYLSPLLKGARLEGGEYEPIPSVATVDGGLRMRSVLGLELRLERGLLRLYDPAAGRTSRRRRSDRGRSQAPRRRGSRASRQRSCTSRQRSRAIQHRRSDRRPSQTPHRRARSRSASGARLKSTGPAPEGARPQAPSTRARNRGGRRCGSACSNAQAMRINVGSLQATPKKETPTERPWMWPVTQAALPLGPGMASGRYRGAPCRDPSRGTGTSPRPAPVRQAASVSAPLASASISGSRDACCRKFGINPRFCW